MVGDSPGPYERETVTHDLAMTSGRIDLRCGEMGLTATVLAGEVEIALVEKTDAVITAFGMTEPVRHLGRRQKLRLTVEADLDQMRIEFDHPPT